MADEPKPNYVTFETRAVEDRQASIDAGHFVAKDVDYVSVTPAGTRDRLDSEVSQWFLSLEEGVKQERIPASWLRAYKQAYKDWKETQLDPEFGTPITSCSMFSPAQVKAIQSANLRSVEELADATEEAISHLGMGGRALKAKARAYLDSFDTGKTAAEVEDLRVKNEALELSNKELRERMEILEKSMQARDSEKVPALTSTRGR